MEYVQTKNSEKVEKMCSQGLDANFHDSQVRYLHIYTSPPCKNLEMAELQFIYSKKADNHRMEPFGIRTRKMILTLGRD